MPDLKISQLPAATTPLAGTELVPIVQSGTTDKVTVADLTAGRAVSASALTASSGNLTFSGTAQRITGDMSNATVANRLAFQTSTTDGSTTLLVIPNGTGPNSGIVFRTSSAVSNDSVGQINIVGGSDFRLNSTLNGTGTYLPMTFYTGGNEAMRIDTSRNVGIGTAPNVELALYKATNPRFHIQNSTSGTGFADGLQLALSGSDAYLWNFESGATVFGTSNTEWMRIDSSGNVIQNTAAVATNATAGFLWITSCAGAPTGAPTAPYTNAAALVCDTTNNRLYVRVGSTWRYATLT